MPKNGLISKEEFPSAKAGDVVYEGLIKGKIEEVDGKIVIYEATISTKDANLGEIEFAQRATFDSLQEIPGTQMFVAQKDGKKALIAFSTTSLLNKDSDNIADKRFFHMLTDFCAEEIQDLGDGYFAFVGDTSTYILDTKQLNDGKQMITASTGDMMQVPVGYSVSRPAFDAFDALPTIDSDPSSPRLEGGVKFVELKSANKPTQLAIMLDYPTLQISFNHLQDELQLLNFCKSVDTKEKANKLASAIEMLSELLETARVRQTKSVNQQKRESKKKDTPPTTSLNMDPTTTSVLVPLGEIGGLVVVTNKYKVPFGLDVKSGELLPLGKVSGTQNFDNTQLCELLSTLSQTVKNYTQSVKDNHKIDNLPPTILGCISSVGPRKDDFGLLMRDGANNLIYDIQTRIIGKDGKLLKTVLGGEPKFFPDSNIFTTKTKYGVFFHEVKENNQIETLTMTDKTEFDYSTKLIGDKEIILIKQNVRGNEGLGLATIEMSQHGDKHLAIAIPPVLKKLEVDEKRDLEALSQTPYQIAEMIAKGIERIVQADIATEEDKKRLYATGVDPLINTITKNENIQKIIKREVDRRLGVKNDKDVDIEDGESKGIGL